MEYHEIAGRFRAAPPEVVGLGRDAVGEWAQAPGDYERRLAEEITFPSRGYLPVTDTASLADAVQALIERHGGSFRTLGRQIDAAPETLRGYSQQHRKSIQVQIAARLRAAIVFLPEPARRLTIANWNNAVGKWSRTIKPFWGRFPRIVPKDRTSPLRQLNPLLDLDEPILKQRNGSADLSLWRERVRRVGFEAASRTLFSTLENRWIKLEEAERVAFEMAMAKGWEPPARSRLVRYKLPAHLGRSAMILPLSATLLECAELLRGLVGSEPRSRGARDGEFPLLDHLRWVTIGALVCHPGPFNADSAIVTLPPTMTAWDSLALGWYCEAGNR